MPETLIALTGRGAAPALDSVTLSTLELNFLTFPKSRRSGASCTVPAETLIEAFPDFVVSVTDFAVRVTGLVGTEAGAVYFAVVASITVTAPHAEEQGAAP